MHAAAEPVAEREPLIEDGAILVYRVYEVADEVDLRAAEARLSALGPTRLRFARVAPRHIQMADPPVQVSLGSVAVALADGSLGGELTARVYDYGAISICVTLPVAGWDFARLGAVGRQVQLGHAIDALATERLRGLLEMLAPALQDPHDTPIHEDYTVYFVSRVEGALSSAALSARVDLAALLLAEAEGERLAPENRESALRHSLSFYKDDLAVIDWSAAFVYEPAGARDVPDVLEYATSQLLELRFYDDLLDRELEKVYEGVARGSRAWNPLLPNAFPELLRYLTSLLVEVTEITEKVDNSLKFIDDFFLAKIYEHAAQRFRIAHWQGSVQRKLALVQSVHQVVQNRIHTSRSLLLELAIVLLIVFEIVMAFVKVK